MHVTLPCEARANPTLVRGVARIESCHLRTSACPLGIPPAITVQRCRSGISKQPIARGGLHPSPIAIPSSGSGCRQSHCRAQLVGMRRSPLLRAPRAATPRAAEQRDELTPVLKLMPTNPVVDPVGCGNEIAHGRSHFSASRSAPTNYREHRWSGFRQRETFAQNESPAPATLSVHQYNSSQTASDGSDRPSSKTTHGNMASIRFMADAMPS
jgi:hypothetical protein